jgi:sec-independent protein translocase protein TatA
MLGIGPLELLIVLGIILVIFGARRLPQLGRDLGSGMREFKDSVTGKDDDDAETNDARAIEGPAFDREPETVDGEVVRERR